MKFWKKKSLIKLMKFYQIDFYRVANIKFFFFKTHQILLILIAHNSNFIIDETHWCDSNQFQESFQLGYS